MDFFCPIYTQLGEIPKSSKIIKWVIIGLITGCVLCCVGSFVLMLFVVIRTSAYETRTVYNESFTQSSENRKMKEKPNACTVNFNQCSKKIENLYNNLSIEEHKAFALFTLSVHLDESNDFCKDFYQMAPSSTRSTESTDGLSTSNLGIQIKHPGVYYIYSSVHFPKIPKCKNATHTWSHRVMLKGDKNELLSGVYTPCKDCQSDKEGHIYLGGVFELKLDDLVQFEVHPPSSNNSMNYGGLMMI